MSIEKQLVSVIIPTYNRENTISKTIRSCLNQTYPFIEIIVIDDGSSDDTKKVIFELSNKNIDSNKYIKYIYQENAGACVARNQGIDNSQGEFIQFLDSDDTMEDGKIEKQVNILKNNKVSCALSDFKYIDEHRNIIKIVKNDGNIHDYTAKLRSVSIMTPLIKRESMLSSLRWNPALKRNQDMDFMFKYFLTIKEWRYIPGAYCNYVIHDHERISGTYHKGMQFFEMYKSFRCFFDENKALIPETNKYIVNKYRNELIKRWIKFKIRSYLPYPVVSLLKSVIKKQQYVSL